MLGAAAVVAAVAAAPMTTALPARAAEHGGANELKLLSPTSTVLRGLTDVEVAAPAGTTAVRFTLGGIAFAELTDLYAKGTETKPLWRTATDASWFPPGSHHLEAEADTPSGILRTRVRVTVLSGRQAEQGHTDLGGEWIAASASELPTGSLDGERPPACRPGFDDSGMTRVIVPGSLGAIRSRWNSAEGIQALYRRTVTLPEPGPSERFLLTFESCYFALRLFVNGEPAGTARGGYVPDVFDVTDLVQPGRNTLAVVVDNRKAVEFPLNPTLYWNYSGIFAAVHLRRTGSLSLTGFTATGAADGSLTLRATGVNTTNKAGRIAAVLYATDPSGRQLQPQKVEFTLPSGEPTVVSLPVSTSLPGGGHPLLWDLENPRLYKLRLVPSDGGPALATRTGFRDVEVDRDQILLNGKSLTGLKGFNRHSDYPGLGRTQPAGLARRELERMHRRGFRLYRPGHYPTTPAELDVADELGFLVIEEINVTQRFNADVLTSPEVIAFGKERLTKLIDRDRSHPSVIAWSVGNENGTETVKGADYVRQITEFGKKLDDTRLFTHVTGWGAQDEGFAFDDFVSVNVYNGWYLGTFQTLVDPEGGQYSFPAIEKKAGTKPIILTEYGAEAVTSRPGYGKGTEYYQGLMIDEYNRLLKDRKGLVGLMYWTSSEFAVSPAGGGGNPKPVPGFHNKGLLTYWREPKLGWRVIFSPVRIDEIPVALTSESGSVDVSFPVTIRATGDRRASGTLLLTPPDGCTITPERLPFTVTGNGSATVRARLLGRPAADAQPGTVRAVVDAETEAQPRPVRVSTPYKSLPAAFNSVGITDDKDPGRSTFSISKKSYSAQALADTGVTPGAEVRHEGTSFAWPDVPAGEPDNVAATGQTVLVAGRGATLSLLCAATYGSQGGTFTVHYKDGAVSTHTLTVDDWVSSQPSTGKRAAISIPRHNSPTGPVDQKVTVWRADIDLGADKDVTAVQLPDSGTPPAGCLHIFALTIA
ncbi:glycoside hydrolase family 2 protein [Streptomyces sp. NPDC048473]|uniref:glycoside hydrolase family 2 protein n=1 Tax=unclassified Streptomyces TaxID=2593676 RepID=UPI0037214A94